MKSICQHIIFSIAFVGLVTAHAANPREELNQMVQQLQKNPGDNALREKIISFAAKLKPAPVIPEEAERRMARGEAAFERAKDAADYANAIREFQAAANAAPWLATPYFNLGVTEEKAGHPNEALKSFRWYLLAAPNAKDAVDIRKRLFKLEYAAEQDAKHGAIRAQEQRISGTWKRQTRQTLSDGESRWEILYVQKDSEGKWKLSYDLYVNNNQIAKERPYGGQDLSLVDGELRFKLISKIEDDRVCATYDVRGNVSPDGGTLNLVYTLMPYASDRADRDCPDKSSYGSHVRIFKR